MANVSVTLGLKNAGFRRGLDDARGQVRSFKKEVESGGGLLGAIGRGAGIATAGIFAFAKSVTGMGGQLSDAATALSMTVEELQGLRAAFRDNGTSTDKFDTAMAKLNGRIADARDGNASAIESFAKLGVGIADLESSTPGEILLKMADGFRASTDKSEALGAAMDILGKSGRTMATGLAIGADGIAQISSEVQKMTSETAQALDAMDDVSARVWDSMRVYAAKAIVGTGLIWDKVMGTIFGKSVTIGVLKTMADAVNTSPSDKGTSSPAAAAASAAQQMAQNAIQTDKLREGLDAQRLENARALMTSEARILSLKKEAADLEEKSKHTDLNKSLELRTSAEKIRGIIAREEKALAEKVQAEADRKLAEDERADEDYLRKKEDLDKRRADANAERAGLIAQNAEDQQALHVQAGASVLDEMVNLARMTPAERSAYRRQSRSDLRAQSRAERAFVRRYGEDELQRIKDANDPAKQLQASFQKAMAKSEESLQQIKEAVGNIESNMGVPIE